MLSNSLSFSIGSAILIIFLAYNYKKSGDESLHHRLNGTLYGLLRAEKKVSVNPKTKIAVGLGSCQDAIVRSGEVLHDIAPEFPQHFDSISSQEELLKVFAYFFSYGAAAERYVSNATLFNELVEASRKAPSAKWALGGNAAVMANRFSVEGCNVVLGAHMSESLKSNLPPNVKVSGPIVEQDDVHLLLEYVSGETWGPFVSPRANRFIIHRDTQNPLLKSLENFQEQLAEFKPHLLVVGGLQMMDNFPMEVELRQKRLKQVKKMMASQPELTRVHFEMASFSDEGLLKELVQDIIPYADSLGMNEQELPNLFHMIMYGNISLVSESYPRVAAVLDQMRDVFRLFQNTKETDGKRRLTRLHVHTLAFQAIMTEVGSPWKNSMSAAAKAALTAHRHTCGSHEIDTEKAKIIMDDSFTTSRGETSSRIPFNADRPVACWRENQLEICVAPVLVCTEVLQTGGGGDNVSSAGLVLQV